MKVDKRQYTRTEPRVTSIDMRGPLFIAGYSEKYSPPYLSVRTKEFLRGNLRSLRINDKQVDWLTPRNSGLAAATPEFHRYSSGTTNNIRQFPSSPATTKRTFETTTTNNIRQFPSSPATAKRTFETTSFTTSSNLNDRKFL
jgi:hypothetical protein